MKSGSIRKLSDDELIEALEHIKYEIAMLLETSKILKSNEELNRIRKNALVESFIIHARSLISFLYDKPIKNDDVMALDYLDNNVWSLQFKSVPQSLETVKIRAHKEVAHITTFRIGKKLVEKNWDVVNITTEIYEKLKIFVKNVPDHLMLPDTRKWFDDQLLRSLDLFTLSHEISANTDKVIRST